MRLTSRPARKSKVLFRTIGYVDDLEFYRAIEPAGYMVVTEGTNHMQNFTPLAVGDFDELVDQMPQAHDWFIDQCAAARKVFD